MPTDEPDPNSWDGFNVKTPSAHAGYWQYIGGRCSACRSISPQTLQRLVDEFVTDHLVEMTESERLDLSETLELAVARIRTNV